MVRFKKRPSGPGEVIDRRGASSGRGLRIGGAGGGIALVVILLMTFLGGGSGLEDMTEILAPIEAPAGGEAPLDPANDPDADLVGFLGDVLQDSQAMWADIFRQSGLEYRATDLVVFSGLTQSGCGGAYAQVGPHYCPLDENVYLDIDFLEQLQARFGARGDTAQAYIVAHEVGHHVQNLLGVLDDLNRIRSEDPGSANEASIAVELQADCFAGVWLSTLRTGESAAILEENDLQEAMNAAAAVGDDAIQERTTGEVNPESWTHGDSEQRLRWLMTGFETGQPSECDTA